MVYFWNLMFFFFLVWFKNFAIVINYLNPATYFLMIPFVKKAFAKKGYENINQYIDNYVNSSGDGLNRTWAGIQMAGLFICLEVMIFNLLQFLIQHKFFTVHSNNGKYYAVFVIVIIILPLFINQYLLFKGDRYLTYFKKFEKMDASVKRKYGWLCFTAAIFIWSMFFLSFSLLKFIA